MSSALDDEMADLMQEVIANSVLTNERIARDFGVSVVDGQTLGIIGRAGGSLTPGAISARTGLPSSTTTRTIDRLERAGLVRREADPQDRRRILVAVVPERLQALGARYEVIRQALGRHNEGYSDEELRLVIRYLRGMVHVDDGPAAAPEG